jgi:uncharacterized protein YlxP (DUF503 family)
MVIGACTIELYLAAPTSLKDKRSILKSLLARLHREFNVSAAEVGLHDVWQSSSIGVTTISTNAVHAQNLLNNLVEWIEQNRPDLEVIDHYIEIINFSSESGN